LRVSDTAKMLARKWESDEEKASLAAMLHDVAKSMNPQKLAKMKIALPENIRDLYDQFEPVWHAFAAPYVAKKKFGVSAPGVLSAMRWHTTGRAKMTRLEQIIFVADFVEPGRKFPLSADLRRQAMEDLDAATYGVCLATLLHLMRRGAVIHPHSWSCRNYYVKMLSAKRISEVSEIVMSKA
jgi:predicted HD superfamily hydrolase involved in NAD metabolism